MTRITRAFHLPGLTLCHVAIHTGRTHQIRVHLSAVGHPIVGDALYGGVHRRVPGDIRAVTHLQRPFLHAARIAFKHPRDDRRLEFTADLPQICGTFSTRFPDGTIGRRSDMDKPAVPHKIRKVFEGRVFTVVVESIKTRKGGEMDAEIVRHPGSVVLIPLTDRGEIILVRQYRHAVGRDAWELPAGTLKPNEEPEKAARRECHEEIGLVPSTVEMLGTFYPTPGYCDEEMNFYKATGLRQPRDGETAEQDEDEDIQQQAFTVEQIRSMIRGGEIVDMKTVAGLTLL